MRKNELYIVKVYNLKLFTLTFLKNHYGYVFVKSNLLN